MHFYLTYQNSYNPVHLNGRKVSNGRRVIDLKCLVESSFPGGNVSWRTHLAVKNVYLFNFHHKIHEIVSISFQIQWGNWNRPLNLQNPDWNNIKLYYSGQLICLLECFSFFWRRGSKDLLCTSNVWGRGKPLEHL